MNARQRALFSGFCFVFFLSACDPAPANKPTANAAVTPSDSTATPPSTQAGSNTAVRKNSNPRSIVPPEMTTNPSCLKVTAACESAGYGRGAGAKDPSKALFGGCLAPLFDVGHKNGVTVSAKDVQLCELAIATAPQEQYNVACQRIYLACGKAGFSLDNISAKNNPWTNCALPALNGNANLSISLSAADLKECKIKAGIPSEIKALLAKAIEAH